MVDSLRQRLYFRWCRIRPASHMPEAERITLGVLSVLRSLDSSTDSVILSPGKENISAPLFTSSMASSSR